MTTKHEHRIHLRQALKDAIRARAKSLCDALEWLEMTDPSRDLDDAALAERNAMHVLADLAISGVRETEREEDRQAHEYESDEQPGEAAVSEYIREKAYPVKCAAEWAKREATEDEYYAGVFGVIR